MKKMSFSLLVFLTAMAPALADVVGPAPVVHPRPDHVGLPIAVFCLFVVSAFFLIRYIIRKVKTKE